MIGFLVTSNLILFFTLLFLMAFITPSICYWPKMIGEQAKMYPAIISSGFCKTKIRIKTLFRKIFKKPINNEKDEKKLAECKEKIKKVKDVLEPKKIVTEEKAA